MFGFSKEEIKTFFIKLGKKYLFPDFTNKLTWMVAGVGISIILTPTPLKLIFYNFLVDTFNVNSGQNFTLAEVKSQSADYLLGFGLVFLALLHNILYKFFEYKNNTDKILKNTSIRNADVELYNKFIESLPSESIGINFLCEHDLGNTYDKDSTNDIQSFLDKWNNPEYEFLDEEIESQKKDFYSSLQEFYFELATQAGFIDNSSSRMTVIPNAYFNRGKPYPDDIMSITKDFNSKASVCCEKHKSFITLCKKKLNC